MFMGKLVGAVANPSINWLIDWRRGLTVQRVVIINKCANKFNWTFNEY